MGKEVNKIKSERIELFKSMKIQVVVHNSLHECNHPNYETLSEYVTKFLVTKYPKLLNYFILLRSNYFPEHFCFQAPVIFVIPPK